MDVRHNDVEIETLPIYAYKVNEPTTLGEYLRNSRIKHGISQRELAQRIGVNPTSVSNWENNHYAPARKFIQNLVTILGAAPLKLVQYDGVISKRQQKILKFLEENPMSSQKACREALGISWDLHEDLRYLLDIGIMKRKFQGGSATVKRGRCEMSRITVEIEDASKNVKHLLYAQNPALIWDFSDTSHDAV